MKLVREHINEKFTEDSDPIHDMGIGMLNQIKKFIESEGLNYIDKHVALRICAYYGEYDFVKFLLEMGAIPKSSTFSSAFDKGYKDIYDLLLKYDKNNVWIDWWNESTKN